MMVFSKRNILPFAMLIVLPVLLFSCAQGTESQEQESAAAAAQDREPVEESAEDGTGTMETETETESADTDMSPAVDGSINEGEYAYSLADNATGIEFFWSHDGQELFAGIKTGSSGWVSAGFDPQSAMKDANIIFMALDGEDVVMRDDFGTSTFSHDDDVKLGGTNDITAFAAGRDGGITVYEFSIPLDSGDEFDRVLVPGNEYGIIFAVNDNGIDFDSKHTARGSASIQLD
jgi:hypothetical protein